MPLLFNKGKDSWRQKGRPATFSDKNAKRWQQKQLRQDIEGRATPAKTAERVEEKIEAKPFDGIKEIKAINPNDYFYLSHYIRKIVNPSEEMEKPVLVFMVNMFLNLPDNFYAPGKDYSRAERESTKEQLSVFLNSLSTLEVICGNYNFGDRIGNFSNKKTYKLEKLSDILNTEIWDGKGSYHLIYLSKVIDLVTKSRKKNPDERTIVNKIANNLAEKGVLILEGSNIKDIERLKLIGFYEKVSLYQRI